MIKITNIKIYLLKYNNKNPVLSSFGNIKFRSSLVIEIHDENNNNGIGEIWCNFPNHGGRYRFEILKDYFIDFLINFQFEDPSSVKKFLIEKFNSIKNQTGDFGAFENIFSGIDCAAWDLFSKIKKKPLNKLINDQSKNKIKVYASGINRDEHLERIQEARLLGIDRFKIKIGFNILEDIKAITSIEETIESNEKYMLDVNQAWSLDNVHENISKLKNFNYLWLEEPIPANHSISEIVQLNKLHKNLAFGENLIYLKKFYELDNDTQIQFLQPDLARYGGITDILDLGKNIKKNKIWLHYLGGAIGLISSAHIMSALNPDGYLEYDINENDLRTKIVNPSFQIINGYLELNENYGIGFQISDNLNQFIDQFYEYRN